MHHWEKFFSFPFLSSVLSSHMGFFLFLCRLSLYFAAFIMDTSKCNNNTSTSLHFRFCHYVLLCFLPLKNCCRMKSITKFCSLLLSISISKWCSIQLKPNVYCFIIILVLFCDRALLKNCHTTTDHKLWFFFSIFENT